MNEWMGEQATKNVGSEALGNGDEEISFHLDILETNLDVFFSPSNLSQMDGSTSPKWILRQEDAFS